MQIISRATAKKLGLERYFTGKPCKRGHVVERYIWGGCVKCCLERDRCRPNRPLHPKQKAKQEGHSTYFTGRPCKYGHLSERFVASGQCVTCGRGLFKEWWYRNHERNLKTLREKHKKRRLEYTEKIRIDKQKQYEKHRTRIRLQHKDYYKNNKGVFVAAARKREKKIQQATPKWADIFAIYEIYKESERISRETGIKHHVDHVVPIVNPRVCGLHVEYNLRVIPAKENLSKHNKLDEELIESLYKDAA